MTTALPFNHRTLALLRAVSAGRAEITASRVPDLFIDGLACGDQYTAHVLAQAGLIRPARPAAVGQRVPAVLTEAGRTALGTVQPAA
ncbi:hypothetical protein [Thermocrispum municipale]|jgi:hypothetical protein|uniref:hypothetical protein n=1 Tax=Thermocrispum municipale TaxID=37926 RepID=UPI00049179A7